MLQLTIPEKSYWDESIEEFVTTDAVTLMLEHSLLSLSKWESHWKEPLLAKDKKSKWGELTLEQCKDYIRCMTVTKNVDYLVYEGLSQAEYDLIGEYIDDPMTATTFKDARRGGAPKEYVTSELIYYWMTELMIPFECQKWHLNRLLTLIRVCNVKKQKPKKMSRSEVAAEHRRINQMRRAQYDNV